MAESIRVDPVSNQPSGSVRRHNNQRYRYRQSKPKTNPNNQDTIETQHYLNRQGHANQDSFTRQNHQNRPSLTDRVFERDGVLSGQSRPHDSQSHSNGSGFRKHQPNSSRYRNAEYRQQYYQSNAMFNSDYNEQLVYDQVGVLYYIQTSNFKVDYFHYQK
jgi:hypothetical protein